MIKLNIKMIGAKVLDKKLQPEAIQKPMADGLKKIAILLERLVKQATVVDTGILRASITRKVGGSPGKLWAKVGTSVEYGKFVEFGTNKMEARHMEGLTKVLGEGMFTYSLVQLKKKMGGQLRKIGVGIEARFEK